MSEVFINTNYAKHFLSRQNFQHEKRVFEGSSKDLL